MGSRGLSEREESLLSDLQRAESMKLKMESLSQVREEELQQQIDDMRTQLDAMRLGDCCRLKSGERPACSSDSQGTWGLVQAEADADINESRGLEASKAMACRPEDDALPTSKSKRNKSRNRSKGRRAAAPLAGFFGLRSTGCSSKRRRSRRRSKGPPAQVSTETIAVEDVEETY